MPGQRRQDIAAVLNDHKDDLLEGVGPKLKQMLLRGVGVHHAGVLPRHKQIVEELFNAKLIPFVCCTETLAAGYRRVVDVDHDRRRIQLRQRRADHRRVLGIGQQDFRLAVPEHEGNGRRIQARRVPELHLHVQLAETR